MLLYSLVCLWGQSILTNDTWREICLVGDYQEHSPFLPWIQQLSWGQDVTFKMKRPRKFQSHGSWKCWAIEPTSATSCLQTSFTEEKWLPICLGLWNLTFLCLSQKTLLFNIVSKSGLKLFNLYITHNHYLIIYAPQRNWFNIICLSSKPFIYISSINLFQKLRNVYDLTCNVYGLWLYSCLPCPSDLSSILIPFREVSPNISKAIRPFLTLVTFAILHGLLWFFYLNFKF